ncbi:MAG TPA: hypothetical protein VEW48_28665 [Thermoanaerobaculia bacterium]|nr:hypothetical protein [Thermoanaerobaculia bacterium]
MSLVSHRFPNLIQTKYNRTAARRLPSRRPGGSIHFFGEIPFKVLDQNPRRRDPRDRKCFGISDLPNRHEARRDGTLLA